jgi:ribonuclease HI
VALGEALVAAQRDALATFITITTQVLGSATALPTTGMRGRPRADGSTLARPRPPDPAPKPPVAPARAAGLHVDFDGGARGNPGVAAGSLLLLLVRGGVCLVLARRADFLGDYVTYNFAEFSGMASGLQLVLDFLTLSAELTPGLRLTVTGDSELVVQAMLARSEVRDPALTALAAQADDALRAAGGAGLHSGLHARVPRAQRRGGQAGQRGHGRQGQQADPRSRLHCGAQRAASA